MLNIKISKMKMSKSMIILDRTLHILNLKLPKNLYCSVIIYCVESCANAH